MKQTTKKILVLGHHGKMGQIAIKAIQNNSSLTYVGGCGSKDNLKSIIDKTRPDVAIDLTSHLSVYKNTSTLIEHNIRPIIGSSGLTNEQINLIKQNCLKQKLGGILAPNFSIGAMLMITFCAQAAKHFPNASINETHHLNKKDAPSATAIATAEAIAANRCQPPLQHASKEILANSLGATHQDVDIHSNRLPGKIAQQTVSFANHGESLVIQHETISRDAFLAGISFACEQVFQFNSLLLGLNQAMLN